MSTHAKLAPSSASRFINCPPSVRMSEGIEDKESIYALEGTAAHEVAEIALLKYYGVITYSQYRTRIAGVKVEYQGNDFDFEAMVTHGDTYVNYIDRTVKKMKSTGKGRVIGDVEVKLDISKYAPESSGTGDSVNVNNQEIHVTDYKYGSGVKVDAFKNSQLMMYALGVYEKYKKGYPGIESVTVTVVQPRLDHIDSYTLTLTELLEWGEVVLKPAAILADKGEGVQKTGDWCRWCKARPVCRPLADEALSVARKCFREVKGEDGAKDKDLLTPKEYRTYFEKLGEVKSWVKAFESFLLEELKKGTEVEGMKLVRKAGRRKIVDVAGATSTLAAANYKPEQVLKPRELRGITDLEKLTGKREFTALLGAYITKSLGAETPALLEDKRQAVNSKSLIDSMFEEIKGGKDQQTPGVYRGVI